MMQYTQQGIELWYGTTDAAAVEGDVPESIPPMVTVAVRPIDAGNSIRVVYRVNGGGEQFIDAKWMRNDASRNIQYFKGHLPPFPNGDTVTYYPLYECAGRRFPLPEEAGRFSSSFRVVVGALETQRLSSPVGRRMNRKLVSASTEEMPILGARSRLSSPEELIGVFDGQHKMDFRKTPMPQRVREIPATLGVDEDRPYPQYITGCILNHRTNHPLSNFTVHGFDLQAGAEARDIGHAVTDAEGRFVLFDTELNKLLTGIGKRLNKDRKLLLRIFNPKGGEVHRTEMAINAIENKDLVFRVNLRPIQ